MEYSKRFLKVCEILEKLNTNFTYNYNACEFETLDNKINISNLNSIKLYSKKDKKWRKVLIEHLEL